MRRVFADTAYFVALVRKRDQLHRQATKLQQQPPGHLVTTEWVLTGPEGVRESAVRPYGSYGNHVSNAPAAIPPTGTPEFTVREAMQTS